MLHLNQLLAQLQANSEGLPAIAVGAVLLNAILAGLIIALAAFILDTVLTKISSEPDADSVSRLVSASNLLIICVGVSGMILLIQQSLVRAVVLFAAIAVVRFRVRVSEKSLGAAFFFAVIAGMSSGLGEFNLTWIFTGIFVVITLCLALVFKFFVQRPLNENKPPVVS